VKEVEQGVSGLLIYASGGKSIRLRYRLLGTPLTVATVDLSADWPAIHDELIALIRSVEMTS